GIRDRNVTGVQTCALPIFQRYEREFKNISSVIGHGITDELIQLIYKSNHIEFFGMGSSLPICVEGARKMTFANRIATARSDWDEIGRWSCREGWCREGGWG